MGDTFNIPVTINTEGPKCSVDCNYRAGQSCVLFKNKLRQPVQTEFFPGDYKTWRCDECFEHELYQQFSKSSREFDSRIKFEYFSHPFGIYGGYGNIEYLGKEYWVEGYNQDYFSIYEKPTFNIGRFLFRIIFTFRFSGFKSIFECTNSVKNRLKDLHLMPKAVSTFFEEVLHVDIESKTQHIDLIPRLESEYDEWIKAGNSDLIADLVWPKRVYNVKDI